MGHVAAALCLLGVHLEALRIGIRADLKLSIVVNFSAFLNKFPNFLTFFKNDLLRICIRLITYCTFSLAIQAMDAQKVGQARQLQS